MGAPFRDRADAGHQLGQALLRRGITADVVVGIPRGGVPVAAEVARVLRLPLDVIVVRKLGVPWQPELAFGALGEDGVRVLNEPLIGRLGVSSDQIAEISRRERAVLDERVRTLRPVGQRHDLSGKDVLIVDDGIATGSTAQAAVAVALQLGAARTIVAAPVGPSDGGASLPVADDDFVLLRPHDFRAVGMSYKHFEATPDSEVVRIMTERD